MASFLKFPSEGKPSPKMFVSTGDLTPYIDPSQPPKKRAPWTQINNVPFVQQATMILPEELYELVWAKIEAEATKTRYAKVILKLQDVLHGDFFNQYIKQGNILMLSEGQAGADNIFSLRDGTLRLDLDKESFERAGLQGHAVRSGARKHVKHRYLVKIDLRQPSMLHGKKGFERIVWAAKNVLNRSVVWLFQDLSAVRTVSAADSPINIYQPVWVDTAPTISHHPNIPVPSSLSSPHPQVANKPAPEDEESYFDAVEWLNLLALKSPLVMKADSIDPYLCRYSLPVGLTTNINLKVLQWYGLISSQWIRQLMISVIKQSRVAHACHFLALSASAHQVDVVGQCDGYTILLHAASKNAGGSDDKMDMDKGEKEKYLANASEDSTANGKGTNHGGLQHFSCFDFVDSTR